MLAGLPPIGTTKVLPTKILKGALETTLKISEEEGIIFLFIDVLSVPGSEMSGVRGAGAAMQELCQGEGEPFSNSCEGVAWASLGPKWEEEEDKEGPFLLGRLCCFMEHLSVWVCLSGRCYVWVIYPWEKVKERATDFGENREQGPEVFQERRGSRAPALGRARKESSCDERK